MKRGMAMVEVLIVLFIIMAVMSTALLMVSFHNSVIETQRVGMARLYGTESIVALSRYVVDQELISVEGSSGSSSWEITMKEVIYAQPVNYYTVTGTFTIWNTTITATVQLAKTSSGNIAVYSITN